MSETSYTYAKMPAVFRFSLLASFVAVGVVVSIHVRESAEAETHRDIPAFALSAEGFTTASVVRPHNRISLDIADINQALSSFPPDYETALTRYSFGRHFNWRDSAHSLAFFTDDYQGRIERTLPGVAAMGLDPTFQHQLIASALMGTGAFSGDGSRRSLPDAARISAIESGILATMLNWCRLEWTEASIRGPQDGNWSLANGSPKNWSELFAFWYGFEVQHSLHEEMTRITERFDLPEHPTRLLTTPLASGQVTLLTESWPEDDAEQVWAALDVAALLLLLDRVADLDDAMLAGGETAIAAQWHIRGTWLAAADSFGRADVEQAQAIQDLLLNAEEFPDADTLRAAIGGVIDQLDMDPKQMGTAL